MTENTTKGAQEGGADAELKAAAQAKYDTNMNMMVLDAMVMLNSSQVKAALAGAKAKAGENPMTLDKLLEEALGQEMDKLCVCNPNDGSVILRADALRPTSMAMVVGMTSRELARSDMPGLYTLPQAMSLLHKAANDKLSGILAMVGLQFMFATLGEKAKGAEQRAAAPEVAFVFDEKNSTLVQSAGNMAITMNMGWSTPHLHPGHHVAYHYSDGSKARAVVLTCVHNPEAKTVTFDCSVLSETPAANPATGNGRPSREDIAASDTDDT